MLITDATGQPIGPNSRLTQSKFTTVRCVTSQKSRDLNYTAEVA